jgi:exodeoxyribonuclease VII large subunit
LFDEKHKNPLPFLPRKISIITSPTGAVVHDILKIIDRRFSNLHLEIVPVKVQGNGAEDDIVSAIEMINVRSDSDVAILARGGGSLEDLHAFNSENVARAVFASKIPIISAVGHETDFSITDFVADFRAPTPSAAAELAVPYKKDLSRKITDLSDVLITRFLRYFGHLQTILTKMSSRLVHPNRKIVDLRLRTDDMLGRIHRAFKNSLLKYHERLGWRIERLFSNNPSIQIKLLKDNVDIKNSNIYIYTQILISNKRSMLRELEAKLYTLSPEAILARGYSITRTIPDAAVIRDPQEVSIGQDLEVMVSGGAFICSVKRK